MSESVAGIRTSDVDCRTPIMELHFQQYSDWVDTYDTLSDEDRTAIRDRIGQLQRHPLFSIISLPTPDGAISTAEASVASVRRQLYPHWELWLPADSNAANSLAEERLRVIPAVPAPDHASLFNAALAAAEGGFVLPLPPDAMLAEDALYELVVAIAKRPATDLLYTDEDRVDSAGRRCMPQFKTGWDPDLMLGRDAIGLLVAYRKTLLDHLGGIRLSVSGAALALYDLSLRASLAISPGRIQHIPAVLCHRPADAQTQFQWDAEGARQVVRGHLAERGVRAHVLPAPLVPSLNRIVHDVVEPAPLVSVIVPTRDRADLLEQCTDAVLRRTDYAPIELLIVDNDSQEATTLDLLRSLMQDPRVRILRHPGPFNYAAMNNRAANEARGEVLLLLNNDVDVIQPNWLGELVSHAVRPDVGAVGAKLLYTDERVQHAGMVLGPDRSLHHQFRFSDRLDPGPNGALALTRSVSAVTGACLAVRRSLFFKVGCMDENLRVAFNDVDLCMRLGDHGYRIVWTPFAELFHREGATRGYDTTEEKQALFIAEHSYFCRSWGSVLESDPFRNPSVVYGWYTTTLATRPRCQRPWFA